MRFEGNKAVSALKCSIKAAVRAFLWAIYALMYLLITFNGALGLAVTAQQYASKLILANSGLGSDAHTVDLIGYWVIPSAMMALIIAVLWLAVVYRVERFTRPRWARLARLELAIRSADPDGKANK